MSGSLLSRLVALALVMALSAPVSVPGLPSGSPQETVLKDPAGSPGVEPLFDYYDLDSYEPNDDSKVDARNISSSITGPGDGPYFEWHTLDAATGTIGDQDWFSFTVSSTDITQRRAFLIEAFTNDGSTDPVIELYGPGLAFTPEMMPVNGPDPVAIAYNDDGPFFDQGSSISFLPWRHGGAGMYYFRVRPYSWGGSFHSCAGPYRMRIKRGTLERIAGASRIETAVNVSKEYNRTYLQAMQPKAVVLANAYNYPDALAGAVLCGMARGPLLLTPRDSLPATVKAEIARTGANRVYVLGGEGAVGPAVVAEIQAMAPAPTVVRVAGNNRYETATLISFRAMVDAATYGTTIPPFAIIASAENYPDALAASALSAGDKIPILLTKKDTLHPSTAAALTTLGVTNVVVVGGTGAISSTVTTQLSAQLGGADRVLRIAGRNRYHTAKEFAVWACDLRGPGARGDGFIGTSWAPAAVSRLDYYHVGVASGENYPDALAGGAICGHSRVRGPILLNPRLSVSDYIFEEHEGKLPPCETDYFSDIGAEPILSSRLFGGSAAVSDGVFLELDQYFGFEGP